MSLIKQIKMKTKAKLTVNVSKSLVDEFNSELEKFNTNNSQEITLDFDNFAKKLIAELKNINVNIEQVN